MVKDDYAFLAAKYTHCENCGSGEGLRNHHCLYHRDRRFPFLNVIQNMSRVCYECDKEGIVSTYEYQCIHWRKRLSEGYDMVAWNEGLPLKVKERWG